MGTKRRRLRELAAREQLFINTALAHIQTDGLLALKMAKVARDCDYATGTLYQHFASKEDLLLAIFASENEKNLEIMRRATEWEAPSRKKILALIVGDILFSANHPDHQSLGRYIFTDAVWEAASLERRQQVLDAYMPHHEAATSITQDAINAGDLDPHGQSPAELTLGFWAMCMGMHTLVEADEVLTSLKLVRPYRWLLRNIHLYLNGLNWQPLLDPFDEQKLNQDVEHIVETLYQDLCFSPLSTEEPPHE